MSAHQARLSAPIAQYLRALATQRATLASAPPKPRSWPVSLTAAAPPPAGLVFDLDGTVLDTMGHHWAAWDTVAREHGIALTRGDLHSHAGKPSRRIMEELVATQGIADVDIPAAVSRKQDLYCALAASTQPIQCVFAVAQAAKAAGIPVAVATGGTRRQVTAAMAAAGVTDFFDALVTCDDVTHGKPHPETFLKAAEAIGVAPEHCVGYEDAPTGMEAIKRAGFLAAIDVTQWEGYPVAT